MVNNSIKEHFFSWLENKKMSHVYFEKNKPDVILTDQNAMALGLKYDSNTMTAPVIIIKGQNTYAKRIIDMGKNNNVFINEEPGLTRDLYFNVPVGKVIPERNYEPIAKIYAKVWDEEKDAKPKGINKFFEILSGKRKKEDEVFSVNIPEKIELQLSKNLFALVKENLFQINVLGIQITKIKVTENECFENEEYVIKLNGTKIKHDKIRYISISPFQQLCIFLTDVIGKYSSELLGRDDILQVISILNEKYPILIQETMKYFSVGEIRHVLCGLLQEKVSIQNIISIFETLADFGDKKHDMDLIIEKVRISVGREICLPYLQERTLRVIGFCIELEKMIENNIIETMYGKSINPVFSGKLTDIIIDALQYTENAMTRPVFLYRSQNRKVIYEAIKNFDSQIAVLSFFEIPSDIRVEYLMTLDIPDKSN